MPTKICPQCNKEFNDPKHKDRIYCSRVCSGLSKRTTKDEKILVANMNYNKNKDIINKRRKKNRLLNINKYRENAINNYSLNKEKILSKNRKYYKANKEKISEQKREYRKTVSAKASDFNKRSKRRSIEKKGDVSILDITNIKQNAKVCYWCHKPLKDLKVHIDHYIPLAKGGKHTLSNLVVSCQSCNNKKHAKDPIEFANSIGRLL